MCEEIEIQLGDLSNQDGHVFWATDPRDGSIRLTEVCIWIGGVKVNALNDLTENAKADIIQEIESIREQRKEDMKAVVGDRDWG